MHDATETRESVGFQSQATAPSEHLLISHYQTVCLQLKKDSLKYTDSFQTLLEAYQALKRQNEALIVRNEALETGNGELRDEVEARQKYSRSVRDDLRAPHSLEERNKVLELESLEAGRVNRRKMEDSHDGKQTAHHAA